MYVNLKLNFTFAYMIQRQLFAVVNKLIKKYPIVAITGPRQSGKSTFLKNSFPTYEYVSLESMDNREFAAKDPRGFLARYPSKTIIDEAQQVPSLFSYLQSHVDETNKSGQYILSGSQNFLLLHNISQSLAGRVALFKLLPFSLQELQNTKWYPKTTEEFLFKGMYPRLYDKKLAETQYYADYIETFVERDVRQLANIGDLGKFRTFLKLCAGRIGQVLNMHSLANDVGISAPTVKNWLSILESSYILFQLRPYHNNFNKRLIKSTKIYFYDTGLACNLLNLKRKEQLHEHYLKGGLFENALLLELMKTMYNKGEKPEFYYWRESNGKEIDLLIEDGLKLHRLEMKYSNTFDSSFMQNINIFNAQEKMPKGNNYLLLGDHPYQKRSDIEIVGWKELEKIKL